MSNRNLIGSAYCIAAVLAAISINVLAEQLPNQIDLKAAYCIPVAQNAIKLQTISVTGDNSALTEETRRIVADGLEKSKTDLRRLQAYLLPRLQSLDPVSVLGAKRRGDEDVARMYRDHDACMTACKVGDMPCWTKCGNKSEASTRIRTCNDLSFLPF